MPGPLDLNAQGVRLFAGRLWNHDFLWFSSYEISKVASTLPYLHNYALTYSMSDFSYGISPGPGPRYDDDLARMPLYCTPAEAQATTRVRFTQNALNDLTGRTDDGPSGRNTPNLGWRVVLAPACERSEPPSGTGFRFYCFTWGMTAPRGVARLGKKGCPVRITWEELSQPTARFADEPTVPSHVVNPLDVRGRLLAYEPISLPPHLLLRRAELVDDWVVRVGEHRVHVPARVAARLQP
ncbi:MAG: type I-D CRISPR-associated protein Cas5/Csc1 [Chloroflexi bacterium]|nr:type I-D CRISPR-associated protein Cas5/Csc1 [Chloroflexota bacterium]